MKIIGCCIVGNVVGQGSLVHAASGSSMTISESMIDHDPSFTLTSGSVSGTLADWQTENSFIIDILYTEHEIGCYADPIKLSGEGYDRIHFTFSDQEIEIDCSGCIKDPKTSVDGMRIFEYIFTIALFSIHPSFGFKE